jgi:carbonic anhydrase
MAALLVGPAVAAGADASVAEGIARLRRGNAAFVAGQFDLKRIGAARRAELAASQKPFATILSCADSRVPPEVVFAQGLGDLFVVRVAGAVPDRAVLGSLEYAAEHLHVPLLVVLGHLGCGAVKAALESSPPARVDAAAANLEHILAALRPAAAPTAGEADRRWAGAVYASVRQNLDDLLKQSPVLSELAASGKLGLLGAVYELDSGRVKFSQPVAVAHTPKGGHP